MDSGAYSAWRLGRPVSLEAYCDYLEANKDWIGTYINLDTINPDDPQASARQSFENYLYMRKRGLDPMVVFHAKEDFSWLQEMIDSGASYIGLAALSLGSHTLRSAWYEHAWQYLVNSKGEPITRVHALGDGRWEALTSFPWYSADSTSWIYSAQRNGMLSLDDNRLVAQRKDKASAKSKQDFEALPEHDAAYFKRFLAKHGIPIEAFSERAADARALRTYLALNFYLEQEQKIIALGRKPYRPFGLFKQLPNADCPGISFPSFKYYSVIGDEQTAWATLGFAKGERGLVSFFYVGGARLTKGLKAFVYDPCEEIAITDSYSKTWALLKKHIHG